MAKKGIINVTNVSTLLTMLMKCMYSVLGPHIGVGMYVTPELQIPNE